MQIPDEDPDECPLIQGELGFPNSRTMLERLRRVLKLTVDLEKKFRLNKDMSGVKQFIKDSQVFIKRGVPLHRRYPIEEREGMHILVSLVPNKNEKCRMIIHIDREGEKPVNMEIS